MAALYIAEMNVFVEDHPDQLLGRLTRGLASEGFDTNPATAFSWLNEIAELQAAFRAVVDLLPDAVTWPVLLEYVLPVIGKRIDCVLLADGLIYVIEYKSGGSSSARAALLQAQQYALNLADFHEESRGRVPIPVAVGAFRTSIGLNFEALLQGFAVTAAGLAEAFVASHRARSGPARPIDAVRWNQSRYFPVPTIIEAATAIYNNHDVRDLARSRSGTDNLETTQRAIANLVADSRHSGAKKLIVITGVPGAGKTLAGLNAVQALARSLNLETEQASFVSGNGPLVSVLQEALKKSIGRQKRGLARSIQSRIREIHRFVRETYRDDRAPADRLLIFDEAQRAWTAAKNLKKFKLDVSEPEMLLEIMGRHTGWSVIVALVGGGQEIHGGEAGLAAWGDAVSKNCGWQVVTSPEAIRGGPSVAGSRLFRNDVPSDVRVTVNPDLHLAISKRSYETDVTAAWVNAALEGRTTDAKALAANRLPIRLTRDIEAARSWLRANARGYRRAGLVASSGATRLRAEGVETPTFTFLGGIDYKKWFLEPVGDFRSSNQLEVALSEFEMQGLEIDLAGLLWGGDLIFPQGRVVARSLRGTKWCVVAGLGDPQDSADDPRTRIQNKYRVLLTRFRKGMVIFVPNGSSEDQTRAREEFDGVYDYLLECGVPPLGTVEVLEQFVNASD